MRVALPGGTIRRYQRTVAKHGIIEEGRREDFVRFVALDGFVLSEFLDLDSRTD